MEGKQTTLTLVCRANLAVRETLTVFNLACSAAATKYLLSKEEENRIHDSCSRHAFAHAHCMQHVRGEKCNFWKDTFWRGIHLCSKIFIPVECESLPRVKTPWIHVFDTILDHFSFLVRSEKCLENASLIFLSHKLNTRGEAQI